MTIRQAKKQYRWWFSSEHPLASSCEGCGVSDGSGYLVLGYPILRDVTLCNDCIDRDAWDSPEAIAAWLRLVALEP